MLIAGGSELIMRIMSSMWSCHPEVAKRNVQWMQLEGLQSHMDKGFNKLDLVFQTLLQAQKHLIIKFFCYIHILLINLIQMVY